MKMKRMLSLLLAICVVFSMTAPAYANDNGEETQVIVSDLDELLAAIEVVPDYSTIYIDQTIHIDRNCVIGKMDYIIHIAASDTFNGDVLFQVDEFENQDISIQSLYFSGGVKCSIPVLHVNTSESAGASTTEKGTLTLYDISVDGFRGADDLIKLANIEASIYRLNMGGNSVLIGSCLEVSSSATAKIGRSSFSSNTNSSLGTAILCEGIIIFDDVSFYRNMSINYEDPLTYGGAIYIEEGANCKMTNSSMQNNFAEIGGAAYVKGTLSLIDSRLFQNECSLGGTDFYVHDGGKLSTEYTEDYDWTVFPSGYIGFYLDNTKSPFIATDDAVFIGMEIMSVPLQQYGARFSFVSEFPEGYIIPSEPAGLDIDTMSDLPDSPSSPGDNDQETDVPQAPDSDDDDEKDDVQQPVEPETPSEPQEPSDGDDIGGDDEDSSTIPDDGQTPPEQPEAPSEPQEPDDGESSEDTSNNGQEPSEPPSEPQEPDGEDDPSVDQKPPAQPETPPVENEPDDDDDYTPPVVERPTYRPPVIIYRPQEPVEPPAPSLACGDAVIDTSRSVILEGYGDGQLHLEDALSRAQMATIIYRLLDSEGIETYDTGEVVFIDVPTDAWHFKYVTTIAKAGIVYGVGDERYNPDAKLTWAQIITVLSRFVETEEYPLANITYNGWARSSIETAVALGWIEDSDSVDPDKIITRGEFVGFVNAVIERYR